MNCQRCKTEGVSHPGACDWTLHQVIDPHVIRGAWRENRLAYLTRYPFMERRTPAPRCWPLPWRPFGIGHPWEVVVTQRDQATELFQCSCRRWMKLRPADGPGRVWRWR